MKLKKLHLIVPMISAGAALFLHGYLGHFSRYIADDFCTAFYAKRLGVLRATWFWYLNWSGRFSASVLDSMIGLLGPRVVPIVVPLTILIWLIVLALFFLRFVDALDHRILISSALSVTSLFTLFLLAPDIRQSLYWGQGMRSVIPPLLLGTVQIIFLSYIQSRSWSKLQLGLWGAVSFACALTAGGFSETYASFQVLAFFLSLLIVLITEKFKFLTTSLFLASGFLGAISAFVMIVLAPGNSERQVFFPPPPTIIGILTISLGGFLTYLSKLVNAPEKIFVILGLFSLAAMIGAQLRTDVDSRFLGVVPSLTLMFIFACFPPAAYGTSDFPPDRTLILPTYFFVMGILALGAVCGSVLQKKRRSITSKFLPNLATVTIVIAAGIHSVGLYRSRWEFTEYAKFWDITDANILRSRGSGATQISIPMIPNWASLNEPNDNPKFWVNACMSSYYGLQILTTSTPSAASP